MHRTRTAIAGLSLSQGPQDGGAVWLSVSAMNIPGETDPGRREAFREGNQRGYRSGIICRKLAKRAPVTN